MALDIKKNIYTLIIFVVMAFISSDALGQPNQKVIALTSGESPQALEYIASLQKLSVDITTLNVNEDTETIDLEKRVEEFSQIIVIGKKAFEFYLKRQIQIPSLVVYVKHSTFHHLIESFKHTSLIEGYSDYLDYISIIYSEPCPKKQIELIKENYFYNDLTVMLSPLNHFMEEKLRKIAKELNMGIDILTLPKDFDINRALNTLPKKHALLALPDKYIYNRHSLKNIIISTYRSDRPIFGFSKNMVKGGAVMSLYSDVHDISKQTFEIIKTPDRNKIRIYPKYTKLAVNKSVVRSMNVVTVKNEQHES